MDQPTFSDLEYQGKKRKTRRELFLERMDSLIPWQRLAPRAHSLPFYPKAGNWPPPLPAARHVESPLRPALLQSLRRAQDRLTRPWHGGYALRGRVGQAVCGSEAVGCLA